MPESLDPSALRNLALVGIAVVVLVGLIVLRLVRKMVLRVVLLGALAGLGLYLWSERAALGDCRATCACSFAGIELDAEAIPGCANR